MTKIHKEIDDKMTKIDNVIEEKFETETKVRMISLNDESKKAIERLTKNPIISIKYDEESEPKIILPTPKSSRLSRRRSVSREKNSDSGNGSTETLVSTEVECEIDFGPAKAPRKLSERSAFKTPEVKNSPPRLDRQSKTLANFLIQSRKTNDASTNKDPETVSKPKRRRSDSNPTKHGYKNSKMGNFIETTDSELESADANITALASSAGLGRNART